jgi:hypothetical protein
MKTVAAVGGVVVFAGLIVMAVAGIAGATAVLVTLGALLAMIFLGGQMGGRHTPNVPPVVPDEKGAGGADDGTVTR